MNKKKLFYKFFLSLFIFSSCQLINISENQTQIKPDVSKSIGTVALLSKELKNGNIYGAMKLIYYSGNYFNPDSVIELEEKLITLARKIKSKPITYFVIDTINPVHHKIKVEYDYLFEVIFETQKVESNWLIKSFIF